MRHVALVTLPRSARVTRALLAISQIERFRRSREKQRIYISELIEEIARDRAGMEFAPQEGDDFAVALSYTAPALSYKINRATRGSLATKIISGAVYQAGIKTSGSR